MILYYLLIEHLSLMDFLHQILNSNLIVQVPFTLLLLELSLLVPQLHKDSLLVGSLSLYRMVQMIVTVLHLADLLIWQVDSPEYVWCGSMRAAS